jgi:hypothetical protein
MLSGASISLTWNNCEHAKGKPLPTLVSLVPKLEVVLPMHYWVLETAKCAVPDDSPHSSTQISLQERCADSSALHPFHGREAIEDGPSASNIAVIAFAWQPYRP